MVNGIIIITSVRLKRATGLLCMYVFIYLVTYLLTYLLGGASGEKSQKSDLLF